MNSDELSKINGDFNAFYHEFFKERWPALLEALTGEEKRVQRFNQFCPSASVNSTELRDENGLLIHYSMDPASIVAAEALEVQDGDAVLDMCAAPGGKSLILAEGLRTLGHIVLNEVSEARRDRLKKVLRQYLPESVRERLKVTGKDGGLFVKTHPQVFDRILVDAPCSGERYLLDHAEDLKKWKPNYSKRLAGRQYALLTAALLAGKAGATVVYSTCAISPLENDEVIRELFERKEGKFKILEVASSLPGFEKTEFGIQYLPDRSGFGPIYISKLQIL